MKWRDLPAASSRPRVLGVVVTCWLAAVCLLRARNWILGHASMSRTLARYARRGGHRFGAGAGTGLSAPWSAPCESCEFQHGAAACSELSKPNKFVAMYLRSQRSGARRAMIVVLGQAVCHSYHTLNCAQ